MSSIGEPLEYIVHVAGCSIIDAKGVEAGPSGWCAIIGGRVPADGLGADPRRVAILKGSDWSSTVPRMTMVAAMEALKELRPSWEAGAYVTIVSNDKVLIDGMTRGRLGWKENGWCGAGGKLVKNVELWKQLDALAEVAASVGWPAHGTRAVDWTWVKGGADLNKEAAKIANAEADAIARKVATGRL